MIAPVLFKLRGAVAGRITRGWGVYHPGVGVQTFSSRGSSVSRIWMRWRERSGGEQPLFTHTFFAVGAFNFFTLVVIHSRRSWSVSSLWKCFFSLPMAADLNLIVSSLHLCFYFPSSLRHCLSPGRFSHRRSALCRSHQATRQELRKPHVLYNKNLESFRSLH
ncbi:hypothetical protein CONLIGDRAFT_54553 [Coniochaeta ligniaria NRRL 30616]|uniref:Uncharacterized protein n=1 Tax=Coniochaeta ligniaria NRRL 30616 TaxID=1408157 RepID=A0A1J7J6E5_9PEZI|nr:hypothetical protein CONLIGDRAFT_54553 [Coniochaeta ligniaria NRRL 30616]